MSEIIDGYRHCGLSKYRPIEDVRDNMDALEISRAVLAQHLGEFDNTYIADIVAGEPDRYAGVMLIDVDGANPDEQLTALAATGIFRGSRFRAETLQSHPAIWDLAADLGFNIVVHAEPTIAVYTNEIAAFVQRHAQTNLVVTHLGIMDPEAASRSDCHERIASLANQPNVFMQLSGFHMFSRPPFNDLLPLVERIIESFEPGRLLYGSNYPLPTDLSVCRAELDLLHSGHFGVPAEAVHQIMYRTAWDLWFA